MTGTQTCQCFLKDTDTSCQRTQHHFHMKAAKTSVTFTCLSYDRRHNILVKRMNLQHWRSRKSPDRSFMY